MLFWLIFGAAALLFLCIFAYKWSEKHRKEKESCAREWREYEERKQREQQEMSEVLSEQFITILIRERNGKPTELEPIAIQSLKDVGARIVVLSESAEADLWRQRIHGASTSQVTDPDYTIIGKQMKIDRPGYEAVGVEFRVYIGTSESNLGPHLVTGSDPLFVVWQMLLTASNDIKRYKKSCFSDAA